MNPRIRKAIPRFHMSIRRECFQLPVKCHKGHTQIFSRLQIASILSCQTGLQSLINHCWVQKFHPVNFHIQRLFRSEQYDVLLLGKSRFSCGQCWLIHRLEKPARRGPHRQATNELRQLVALQKPRRQARMHRLLYRASRSSRTNLTDSDPVLTPNSVIRECNASKDDPFCCAAPSKMVMSSP